MQQYTLKPGVVYNVKQKLRGGEKYGLSGPGIPP
jgi:hypothetical protein